MENHQIDATLADMGLSHSASFVPFSQSRNAGEKMPSLNWQINLTRNGRFVLGTDYMQGCAHCRSYKQGDSSVMRDKMVREECETGRVPFGMKKVTPTLRDVMYSLVMDANTIDYASFEEWADEFGYDHDSRKAEAVYKQCLEIALKLRNAIGEDGLAKLREAFQDY